MKKIALIALLLLTLPGGAQNHLNVGVNGGMTIGGITSKSNIAFGAELNYLIGISEDISIGPSLNLIYFSPTPDYSGDGLLYVPVGAAFRLNTAHDRIYIGADAGFAVGITPSGDRGGIFFKPMIGYRLDANFKLTAFYSGIKKKIPSYGFLGLGIVYDFLGGDEYYTF